MTRRLVAASLVSACLAACVGSHGGREVQVVEFWGMGREGEVVAELVPEFERRNPGIHVVVQQIPWTAAHEKLLTAHVGGSLPDIAQMGNTWIPEFQVVRALEDLTPYASRSATVRRGEFFDGIWETSLIDGHLFGVPWYVDTRVLFYRTDLLREAGFANPPRTWSEWVNACRALREKNRNPSFKPILLPTNEWPQPVVLALNSGATFVNDDATARFVDPRFLEGFTFYLDFFSRGDAPVVAGSQIANLYQQFGEGEFAMLITGPWNVGEMRRRLPADKQDEWTTAPIPARDGAPYPGLSIAGGSSLAIFATSPRKDAAWKFVEFLTEPEQQVRFYELSGNLPARRAAWDAPALQKDREMAAFRTQLDHTVALPRIPEWERIATAVFEEGELAARGRFDAAEGARRLDVRVNAMLDKRRWVLSR
ncbi:MAG: sugar ABC transporter substrate-binding protein [Thermoanaerobaculia bacterium]|jgi:multiple sugar transport system substrate-binding protein